ncbi:MAG: acyl-CoA/acyl-ACP dehydrogenase, partial [Desulfobacterales bacterium]|nr:acyl-CoA/acyl-ACP dehydrogenase [Desulfobacterales bacterium]
MDFILDEDVQMINEAIQRFLEKEVLPLEEKYKKDLWAGRFNDRVLELGAEIRKKSVELGYYNLHMPESLGGAGMGHVAMTAFRETIAKSGTILLGLFILGDPPMGPTAMLTSCTDVQKEK